MLNCTGWKVGWMVGPKALIKQAMFVHESTTFNNNVPGQVAVAQSLDQAFNQSYKGKTNYLEYTSDNFQESRDNCLDLLKMSTKIDFKPTACESGYFMAVDITDAKNHIPERYFAPNVNYEDDADTIVSQMHFVDNKVPLDFAFSRWLAIEKGVSVMPLSNFCLQESETKITNMARIAICKTPETFKDPELISKFVNL